MDFLHVTMLDDDLRAELQAAMAHVEVKAEARASSGDLNHEQLLGLFRGNERHLPPGVRRRMEGKGMVLEDGPLW